jgi:hypothetical protein
MDQAISGTSAALEKAQLYAFAQSTGKKQKTVN